MPTTLMATGRMYGTIPSLWEANMEVLDPEHSGINLFDTDWKIYSRNSGMTGHKISADAVVENSLITDGCVLTEMSSTPFFPPASE